MIGIAGFGFVGQAMYSCLKIKDYGYNALAIYDPPKGFSNIKKLSETKAIFCCLPSPMREDGSQDFSAYAGLFTSLIAIGYQGIVVVKSTVLYSNIQPYLDVLHIVMNPEFLNQNTADEDFKNQKIIILGGRADWCAAVEKLYESYFELNNPAFFRCTEQEAIDIKYTHNVYHAYKVLFWNYIQDTCGNRRKIFSAYSKITGNTFEMQNICADGLPGYGGACFPKDVHAVHSDKFHELTEFMTKYNKKLRGNGK